MGKPLSWNLRRLNPSASNSAGKHRSWSKQLCSSKTPKSEESLKKKPKVGKFKQENPFSIYFK